MSKHIIFLTEEEERALEQILFEQCESPGVLLHEWIVERLSAEFAAIREAYGEDYF